MTKIILPHSGYRNLIVYKKSDVIYQGTVVFCRRFLPAALLKTSGEAGGGEQRDKKRAFHLQRGVFPLLYAP